MRRALQDAAVRRLLPFYEPNVGRFVPTKVACPAALPFHFDFAIGFNDDAEFVG